MADATSPPEATGQVPEPSAAPTAEAYGAFVAGVELRSIRMTHCRVDAPTPHDKTQPVADLRHEAVGWQPTAEGFVARQRLEFRGGSAADPTALQLAAEFALEYSAAVPPTEELLAVFQEVNAPVNVWPYFRELLHSAIGRTGWPTFMLPALKTGVPQLPPADAAAPPARPRRERKHQG